MRYKKHITLIYRKQFPLTYSIEFIFDQLISSPNPSCKINKFILPRFSNSFFNRIINILAMLRLRHQIVHVTGDVHYTILGACFNYRILTIHDLAFMHQNKGIKRSILKWFWITLPVKFAHQVTVISEATKTDLLSYVAVDPKKINVIPDFISATYQPVPDRKFNADLPRILQIGTAFNKNIDRLAEAIAGIPCTLIIVGELSELQKTILEKFKIDFINKLNLTEQALYQEYANADLLTFVSTIEGFGMPILEANACGLPVITSNCSAMPEIAGDAALLVNPFDATAIRNGISEIIKNETLRNKLIEKGFENVKRFSKEKVVEQYKRLYEEAEN
ncbi:glycosyltransferase family 4 protein [Mucilaginibacter arboris]|uniref:Glycosyltransferase n=1 Tax=Mucilaginibacter arboris TaxID=2682090 RepID=A0A7K1SUJ3_9SPHI|nr:glycosyltransferase family 1 protein [Mucilaginibacter arboris]MVN20995.1 glycosyltransferase [Mucilaginibacter arboris]